VSAALAGQDDCWRGGVTVTACAAFLLRRDGQRPLRFHGELLGCSDAAAPPCWSRLRLALYGCADGGFVAEIHAVADAAPSCCQAARFAALEDAVAWFERAAPALGECAAPAGHDTAALLFVAAGRLCRDAARNQALRHAVGIFLHRMALGGGDK
jgi:hypothetical protein